ncbi:hypothetical protein [Alicyclobacillus sendaiensis]|uniref:hypothetical protein n=1 Tax=Alicyclobacillus sendaiensis TaxID=192387 RepID=UPI000783BF05|nr:hypothetical protein [Alicyclobacillus sendaiensis]
MKPYRMMTWCTAALLAAWASGCGSHPAVAPAAKRETASPNSSPVVVAEVLLSPQGSLPVTGSATMLFNRQTETLTVSVNAAHLAPGERYELVLLAGPGAEAPRALGAFQADARGNASSVTVVPQVTSLPSSGWRLEMASGRTVVAAGPVRVVPTGSQLPNSLPSQ